MALAKKPVNGMKDILPAEMEIRDYVTDVIKDTYRSGTFCGKGCRCRPGGETGDFEHSGV